MLAASSLIVDAMVSTVVGVLAAVDFIKAFATVLRKK
jgi:flagellar motor component MotA